MSNSIIKNLFTFIELEESRQKTQISLIASENIAYPEVLKILSSSLTNKYAEGYPNNRYYSGCKYIDEIENIAIEEAKKTFKCSFANVQSLTGSIANFSIYQALLEPGDTILSLELSHGGHLTHNSKVSFVSNMYKCITYSIDEQTGLIDYDQVKRLSIEHKPKLIIAGITSYSREISFEKFKEIAELNNSYLLGDISHLSGLIISGFHQHCFPYCDVVMTTTHKQLRGPRAAIILWNNPKLTEKINKSVFPRMQGGPKVNEIAAIAFTLIKTQMPDFKDYYSQVLKNSKALLSVFQKNNCLIVNKTTQNHMFILDCVSSFGLTGKEAESLLEKANICANKNLIFNDKSAINPSGLRIGVLWITTLGFKEKESKKIGEIIYSILSNPTNKEVLIEAKCSVKKLLNI